MKFSFRQHLEDHPELYGYRPKSKGQEGKNADGGPAVDDHKEFKERLAASRGMSYGPEAKFKKGN